MGESKRGYLVVQRIKRMRDKRTGEDSRQSRDLFVPNRCCT